MHQPVSMPLWLVVLLVLLAALALLSHFLLPSVRWFFRRKINRVIHQLNDHLQIEIQPFKLTQRQSLIDRLVFDSKVLEAARIWAAEQNLPREAAMVKVKRYAREIVPAFNAYLYFRVAYWLGKKIAQLLFRVRIGFADDAALKSVPANASVVFLVNHRSNMDYILVTFFAASRTALSYAVGEWARIWPLQSLIRALGAYFVRRRSGNELYRKVLQRYVQIATAEGVTQAVFPEGGLSRDGRLQPAKLGLLDYLLRDYDPDGSRDLVFIPVGVNYDRTLEDRTLTLEKEGRQKPGKFKAGWNTLRFLGRHLWLMLRGHWFRFGYACVNFGPPFSMKAYLTKHHLDFRDMERDQRFLKVEALAKELMDEVGAMIPVLPVALIAQTLCQQPATWMDSLSLKAHVNQRIETLQGKGAHVYLPREDRDYAITVGLRMLTLRHLLETQDGHYRASAANLTLLQYYANSIEHFADATATQPASETRAAQQTQA